MCLFIAFAVLDQPETFQAMLDLLSAFSGVPLTGDGVTALGKKVLTMERDFNARAGFTATVAELRDLESKVTRAMEFRGARYVHILVPCPLGWGHASDQTIRMARLAKETGLFPVFEAERGEVTRVSPIKQPVPVEEYLQPQSRYAHLFRPTPQPDVIAAIQALADRNIHRYGLLPAREGAA